MLQCTKPTFQHGCSQEFSKLGSQCVTPGVLTPLSCREYFDTKQIQQSELSKDGFGAKSGQTSVEDETKCERRRSEPLGVGGGGGGGGEV